MSNVPRASDFTGKKSPQELAEEREWQRARRDFQADRQRYGYGGDKGKEAWKRRTGNTRSH